LADQSRIQQKGVPGWLSAHVACSDSPPAFFGMP
jgi:hypothetical protein